MYKYELHLQTKDFAPKFSDAPSAEEVVEKYIDAGYSGLVLTNPWGKSVFENEAYAEKDIKKLGEEFVSAYEKLKIAAGNDLTVLLGAEVTTVTHVPGDFLIYGVTPEFILDFEEEKADPIYFSDFIKYVHSKGDMLVYQASPFAPGSIFLDYDDVEGLEVYNHRKADICRDFFACERAEYYGMGSISGSDLCYSGGSIGGGIATEAPITSNTELVSVLKSREYRLIKEGKIENV